MNTCLIEERPKDGPPQDYPNRYAAIPPNREQCPFTGLKHAKLYTLLPKLKGKVRTVNLREEGAKRGKTLFHVGDMLRYLDSLSESQSRRAA